MKKYMFDTKWYLLFKNVLKTGTKTYLRFPKFIFQKIFEPNLPLQKHRIIPSKDAAIVLKVEGIQDICSHKSNSKGCITSDFWIQGSFPIYIPFSRSTFTLDSIQIVQKMKEIFELINFHHLGFEKSENYTLPKPRRALGQLIRVLEFFDFMCCRFGSKESEGDKINVHNVVSFMIFHFLANLTYGLYVRQC